MPGDEHKIMNRAENRARSAIISSTKCIQTTVSHKLRRGNKMAKCFSCPGDCKELSKKTRRTHTRLEPSRDQAMVDPTADLRQLGHHEADRDK